MLIPLGTVFASTPALSVPADDESSDQESLESADQEAEVQRYRQALEAFDGNYDRRKWTRLFANSKIEANWNGLRVIRNARAIEDAIPFYERLMSVPVAVDPDAVSERITLQREKGLLHFTQPWLFRRFPSRTSSPAALSPWAEENQRLITRRLRQSVYHPRLEKGRPVTARLEQIPAAQL